MTRSISAIVAYTTGCLKRRLWNRDHRRHTTTKNSYHDFVERVKVEQGGNMTVENDLELRDGALQLFLICGIAGDGAEKLKQGRV